MTYVAYSASQTVFFDICQFLIFSFVGEDDVSTERFIEFDQKVQKGTFAVARRPYKRNDASLQSEVEVMEKGLVELEGDIFELDLIDAGQTLLKAVTLLGFPVDHVYNFVEGDSAAVEVGEVP